MLHKSTKLKYLYQNEFDPGYAKIDSIANIFNNYVLNTRSIENGFDIVVDPGIKVAVWNIFTDVQCIVRKKASMVDAIKISPFLELFNSNKEFRKCNEKKELIVTENHILPLLDRRFLPLLSYNTEIKIPIYFKEASEMEADDVLRVKDYIVDEVYTDFPNQYTREYHIYEEEDSWYNIITKNSRMFLANDFQLIGGMF